MTVRIITGDCRDVLKNLEDESVHCAVTSPPYFGLRDYGVAGQIGLEKTPDQFVTELVSVMREVRRILRADGTLWLNLGDSYAGSGKGGNPPDSAHQKEATNRGSIVRGKRMDRGSGRWGGGNLPSFDGIKPKDLIGIPWLVAFALRADGWYLRQRMPWVKRNPMPESTDDRPTSAVEEVFLLSKSRRYFYDYESVKRGALTDDMRRPFAPGQVDKRGNGHDRGGGQLRKTDKQRGHSRRHAGFNDRWDAMEREEQRQSRAFRNTDLFFGSLNPPHGLIGNDREIIALDVATHSFKEAHFATFPPSLIEPCVKAGCPSGGTILDPFGGSGTTGLVADRLGRNAIMIELNPEYAAMAERRIKNDSGMFAQVAAE